MFLNGKGKLTGCGLALALHAYQCMLSCYGCCTLHTSIHAVYCCYGCCTLHTSIHAVYCCYGCCTLHTSTCCALLLWLLYITRISIHAVHCCYGCCTLHAYQYMLCTVASVDCSHVNHVVHYKISEHTICLVAIVDSTHIGSATESLED